MVLVGSPGSVAAVPTLQVYPSQVPHAPIAIQGNANFTSANGVIGGSGTPNDPYVIAGWRIDASTANGIDVQDTTAHFVLRDIEIGHASPDAPFPFAVFLRNVTDAAIRSVNVTLGPSGFYVILSTNVSVDRVHVDAGMGAGLSSIRTVNLVVSNSSFNTGGIDADGAGVRIVQNQARWISVAGARDIVIDRNRLESMGKRGTIVLNWTENALVSRNVGLAEILTGWAGGGNNTQVIGNDVSGGQFGIKGLSDTNLTIAGNNVSGQSFGAISLFSSSTVTVYGNRIANSVRGVYIRDGRDLLVTHNDFESNLRQAETVNGPRVIWNETYPVAGNHWSDYIGNDFCSGPRQDTCLGPDGIGDAPYVIDANNEDFLPLMRAPAGPTPNLPPHAGLRVTPEYGTTGTVFRFDASSSWDGEDPSSALAVRWDWEGDGTWDTGWSVDKIATHQFPDPGSYAVRLEVQDTGGLTGDASQTVTVTLSSPAPMTATLAGTPTSGTMPLTVSFTSDVNGGVPPYQYRWDFGDGEQSSLASPTHTYAANGTYAVSLTITDARGQSVTRTFELVVPFQSTPPRGLSLTEIVLAASIAVAAVFGILWWNERRRGRAPPGPPPNP